MNDALKFFVYSVSGAAWLAVSFVLLFLVAPALVSATSTIAVVAGFATVLFTVVSNITLGIFLVKYHLLNNKEPS